MDKILRYLNIQIIFVILVNIFLADITFISLPILLYSFLEHLKNIGSYLDYPLIILYILSILRLFVLPILYTILEKKSKNEIIQKFIYNLKNSNKYKGMVLLITFMPVFLFIAITNFSDLIKPGTDLQGYFWTLFICEFIWGLFGSYLVLFLYWYIKDKINRIQEKSQ